MTPGTKVRITGQRPLIGTVKIADDTAVIIEAVNGSILVLRRDPASTRPLQWRWAGAPVEMYILPDAEFRKRLADLMTRSPR